MFSRIVFLGNNCPFDRLRQNYNLASYWHQTMCSSVNATIACRSPSLLSHQKGYRDLAGESRTDPDDQQSEFSCFEPYPLHIAFQSLEVVIRHQLLKKYRRMNFRDDILLLFGWRFIWSISCIVVFCWIVFGLVFFSVKLHA